MQPILRCLSSILLMMATACATSAERSLAVADMLPGGEGKRAATPDHMIFFDLDSAVLTPESIAVLDRIVRDPARPAWSSIQLAGHADRSGAERHNRTLSAARANAVRQYLIAADVPASTIVTAAYGERQVLVGTPDGAVEPQNRRVEIFLVTR